MPEEAQGPVFVRFVSSVKGRLVARWDTPNASFGARVVTGEERKAGGEPIVWDEACVIPLTAAFCDRFVRELSGALRDGDLQQRTAEDYAAWLEAETKREADRDAELKAATEKAAEQPAPPAETTTEASGTTEPTEPTPPPDEASSPPKGRKKQQ